MRAAASRPLVKICGITRTEDALACVDLGADLIGLNFYEKSPRRVSPPAAREIADAVRYRVEVVGVFVNHEAAEIEAIADEVGLDRLQFHGDEPAEFVEAFGERALPALRVSRRGTFDPGRLAAYPSAWGFLFDVAVADAYGGTGRCWSYEAVAAAPSDRPTLLAGGVDPGNARAALAVSGRGGVDVCSGVESTPGVKKRSAIARLIEEVRRG